MGGRVEATPTISSDGSLLFIGSHDCAMHALATATGDAMWRFVTGGVIKSAAIESEKGMLWFGSYDHHLYGLWTRQPVDRRSCKCDSTDGSGLESVWKYDCGGNIFGTPAVDGEKVFVASTSGVLKCLALSDPLEEPTSGQSVLDECWSFEAPAPFFSSPSLAEKDTASALSRLLIGCANGSIYCLDASSGALLWMHMTAGPVFSSVCLFRPQCRQHDSTSEESADVRVVLVGSNDHKLYCIELTTGCVRWKATLPSPVFASPFAGTINGSTEEGQLDVVVACATNGALLVLDERDGRVCAQHQFSGEVFSSPVVCAGRVFVGCRNDFLYALQINS
jgi:acyl-CoA synthetase